MVTTLMRTFRSRLAEHRAMRDQLQADDFIVAMLNEARSPEERDLIAQSAQRSHAWRRRHHAAH